MSVNEEARSLGSDGRLRGVLVRPERPRGDVAAVFITAGLLHKPGPYRLYTDLSRQLGAAGFPCLRFDLSGIGESGSRADGTSAEHAAVSDVGEVLDDLAGETGCARFVLAGLCSGAEVAHRAALADERVCGFIAMDGYIPRTPLYYFHHYLPRVLSARKWLDFLQGRLQRWRAHPTAAADTEADALMFWSGPGPDRDQLAREFEALCARGVRQLQVFSGGSGDCSYAGQFRDAFRDVDFRGLVTVRHFGLADHMYVLRGDRRRLVRAITRWTEEHFGLAHPARQAGGHAAGCATAVTTQAIYSRQSLDAAPGAGRRSIE